MKKLLLIALLLAGGLLITNPDMDTFTTFVERYTKERIQERTGDGVVGSALAGAGASVTAAGAPSVTERTNYGVVSVYAVDPDEDGVDEWRFLGIGGQFIALQEPEE
jgi:hypothetical protein